jgi:hypothetical protein
MAFTVEDGSVVADANAYITVAFFESFHLDRGTDLSALTTSVKQTAIVRATDYVDKRFAKIFKGRKSQSEQNLEWPRIGVWDESGYWIDSSAVPVNLKRAIAEYSWIAIYRALLETPAPAFNVLDVETGEIETGTGGSLTRDMSRVGPIVEDKWYADPSRMQAIRAGAVSSSMVSSVYLPEYPRADEWLKTIVQMGTTRLVRA